MFLPLMLAIFISNNITAGINLNDTITDIPITDKKDVIPWFEFKWMPSTNYFNLDVEKAHIIIDTRFDNLHEPYPVYFRMTGQDNYIYARTRQSMVWHMPPLEKKIKTTQAAGSSVTETFHAIDVKFGESKVYVGKTSLRVVPDPEIPIKIDGDNLSGSLGSSILNDKVLYIDFPSQRMAIYDHIPDIYKGKGKFFEFDYNMGYVTIPVTIDGRKYWFWLSGDSPPAVEIYNKRLFNKIISETEAEDSLFTYNENNRIEKTGGYKPGYEMYFEGHKLSELDIYYVEKSKRWFSGKRIIGTLSNASFFDYIMIIDHKNSVFGLVPYFEEDEEVGDVEE